MPASPEIVLVLGATGTTGGLIAAELVRAGVPTRGVSRSTTPRFDWGDPSGWDEVLENVRAVYLLPPLGELDPAATMTAFITRAREQGARRVVLLSAAAIPTGSPGVGRVAEVIAQMVPEWAVLRPSWFMQNFVASGHYMAHDLAESSRVLTATGAARIAFVDARDIAAVAAWALTTPEPPQAELIITGPQAISYDEVAAEIASASGRDIRHESASRDQVAERIASSGVPAEFAAVLAGLEDDIRAGSEDRTTDVVERVTGRPARSFGDFAREHADVWRRS